jgi:hypothetical protein
MNNEDYRARAAECQRMAEQTRNDAEKTTWLEMAASWMRMIQQPAPSQSEKFDAQEHRSGTRQPKSTESH